MLLFLVAGLVYLGSSHAASAVLAVEAENGTLIAGATNATDATAAGGSAVRFGSTGATQTQTYTASDEILPNPETGFYDYTESHYQADGSGFNPLSASELAALRTSTFQQNGLTFGPTALIHRYYYLEKFQNGSSIDASYLAKLDADLATVRTSGDKIILRFAYTSNFSGNKPYGDASAPAALAAQIDQLAPVLNKYADVVTAVETGFIGVWGEWYYTDNYTSGSDMSSLSATDWINRTNVLNTLLSKLDPRIFVLVRYVGIKQHVFGLSPTDPNAARVGFHNDAFTASSDDYGTFSTFSAQSTSQNKSYLAAQSAVPMTGESATYTAGLSDWSAASAALAQYHWTSLNPNYYAGTLQSWGQTNINEVGRRLGYRLELVNSSLTTSSDGTSNISITLKNTGYAAPFRNRPVNLVLVSGTNHITVPFTGVDIRSWKPGTTFTISTAISQPMATGSYKLYLVLPDPSTNLTDNTAYGIRFANVGTWDGTIGNALNLSLQR